MRRDRIRLGDRAGVTREMEYCEAAMKARRAVVADLSRAELAAVEDRRAHNAALVAEARARDGAIDAEPVAAAQIRGEIGADGPAVAVTRARAALAGARAAQKTEANDGPLVRWACRSQQQEHEMSDTKWIEQSHPEHGEAAAAAPDLRERLRRMVDPDTGIYSIGQVARRVRWSTSVVSQYLADKYPGTIGRSNGPCATCSTRWNGSARSGLRP